MSIAKFIILDKVKIPNGDIDVKYQCKYCKQIFWLDEYYDPHKSHECGVKENV